VDTNRLNEKNNKWIHRLAVITAFATLCLIGLGGLVTSKEAGLAVPDWPTSYGYNMFLFPIDWWIGNIFYEHSHRLLGSLVGLLTAGLAGWIWVRETAGRTRIIGLTWIFATLGLMGVREQGMFVALAGIALLAIMYCVFRITQEGSRLHWWAMVAFCAVLVQGVLGGLRVTMLKDEIGIIHGALAQLFLVLICAIALGTSRWWLRQNIPEPSEAPSRLKWVYAVAAVMIFGQLLLGASMRHQHAGLAVPDFPMAHGQWWPATDPASIEKYNQARLAQTDSRDYKPITAAHVNLHMAHRVMALIVVGVVVWLVMRTRHELSEDAGLHKPAWCMAGWVATQAFLGVVTVIKNKPADIATLHVVVGAMGLTLAAMMCLAAHRTLPSGKTEELTGLIESPSPAVN